MNKTIDIDLFEGSAVSPGSVKNEAKEGATETTRQEGEEGYESKELPYEDQVEKWKVQTTDLYYKNVDKLKSYKLTNGWFISYKQSDGSDTLAERLYSKLPGDNWFDMMYTGERTVAAMVKGIMRRKKFVCFLSPGYFASNFCVTELTIALKGNRAIVPVYNQDKFTAGEMLNVVPECFSDLKKKDFIGLFRDIIPCEGQIAKVVQSGREKSGDEFNDSDQETKEDIKREETISRMSDMRSSRTLTLKESEMARRGNELIKYCSDCLRSSGWISRKTKNDCGQYTLDKAPISGVNSAHTGKLKPPMIKSTGVISKPAEEVIRVLSNVELRGVYNKSFKSGEVLQHYNAETSLRYELYQGTFYTMMRDFLLLHSTQKDPRDSKTTIIAQVSTQDSLKPKYATIIRAEIVEAWFVTPLNKFSCFVQNIVHVKLGGLVGKVDSSHWKSLLNNVEYLRQAIYTGKKRNE